MPVTEELSGGAALRDMRDSSGRPVRTLSWQPKQRSEMILLHTFLVCFILRRKTGMSLRRCCRAGEPFGKMIGTRPRSFMDYTATLDVVSVTIVSLVSARREAAHVEVNVAEGKAQARLSNI
jgi:hypothetical protein